MKHFFVKAFLLLLALTGAAALQAQKYDDYVKWTARVSKLSDCTYDLVLTATIAPGWHIYSQKEFENGPMPTQIVLAANAAIDFKRIGSTSEPEGETDKSWKELENIDVHAFSGTAEFHQKIQVLSDKPVTINGAVYGQVCNKDICLIAAPPAKFTVTLGGKPCPAEN